MFKLFSRKKKEDNIEKSMAKKLLKNLEDIADDYFPYKDPKNYRSFSTYKSLRVITFGTRGMLKKEVFSLTGLTSLVCTDLIGEHAFWEANLDEYELIFNSKISKNHKRASSALFSIHESIKKNYSDYANFINRYFETVETIKNIIDKNGIKFIMNNEEIEEKLHNLISSFALEFRNYTDAIEKHKKEEVLELISIEQQYINKSIEDDSFIDSLALVERKLLK